MNDLDIAIASWETHRTGCRHAVGSAETHRALCDTAARIWQEIIRTAARINAANEITKKLSE